MLDEKLTLKCIFGMLYFSNAKACLTRSPISFLVMEQVPTGPLVVFWAGAFLAGVTRGLFTLGRSDGAPEELGRERKASSVPFTMLQ